MTAPGEKLLILDLDETLVHATTTSLPDRTADFRAGFYHVYERPHVRPFLQACFAAFTVAVWTSGSPLYAAEIVENLFGEKSRNLLFVWASDRCSRGYDADAQCLYPRKNLAKVRRRFGWPVASIIAVDDTPQKWAQSYGNLVRVSPFEGNPADDELPRLLTYLCHLRDSENVRTIEKRGWQKRKRTEQSEVLDGGMV